MPVKGKLTFKQLKFAREYAKSGNGKQAAMKSFAVTTPGAAAAVASRALTNANVVAVVKSIADRIPDDLIVETHIGLLKSSRLDHMVFPLGPKNEKEKKKLLANRKPDEKPVDYLTDEDITKNLAEVACTVRQIVHGETARHVYFWTADNRARQGGVDMAHKIKGTYAPEKHKILVAGFGQVENLDNEHLLRLTQREGSDQDQG